MTPPPSEATNGGAPSASFDFGSLTGLDTARVSRRLAQAFQSHFSVAQRRDEDSEMGDGNSGRSGNGLSDSGRDGVNSDSGGTDSDRDGVNSNRDGADSDRGIDGVNCGSDSREACGSGGGGCGELVFHFAEIYLELAEVHNAIARVLQTGHADAGAAEAIASCLINHWPHHVNGVYRILTGLSPGYREGEIAPEAPVIEGGEADAEAEGAIAPTDETAGCGYGSAGSGQERDACADKPRTDAAELNKEETAANIPLQTLPTNSREWPPVCVVCGPCPFGEGSLLALAGALQLPQLCEILTWGGDRTAFEQATLHLAAAYRLMRPAHSLLTATLQGGTATLADYNRVCRLFLHMEPHLNALFALANGFVSYDARAEPAAG